MTNQKLLRLSSTLVFIGVALVTIIVEFLHPGGGTTYEGTLAIWATSWDWTAIHLGQFVGMAGIGAGLLGASMIWLYLVAWLGKASVQAVPS